MNLQIILTYLERENESHLEMLANNLATLCPFGQIELRPAHNLKGASADLVVAMFNLKPTAFAPLSFGFQSLRDQRIALMGLLSGPVNFGRINKTLWGTKKQFCGNEILAAYFSSYVTESPTGVSDDELQKCRSFLEKLYLQIINEKDLPSAVNF